MTNEINESFIKQSQSKILIENTNGQINNNTVESKDKKVNQDNNNNNDNFNAVNISPIPHQRRAKNQNSILLEIPNKSKKVSIQGDNFTKKKSLNKTKISNAKSQNITNYKNDEKIMEAFTPKRKGIFSDNKFYNVLDLVDITNKIYVNENHLNRGIISKKQSHNSINVRDLIRAGKLNNGSSKKNVISFNLNDNNNNKHHHHHHHKKKDKEHKKKRSYTSKMKEINKSQDKANFTGFTNIKQNMKNNTRLSKLTKFSNNDGDLTSKHAGSLSKTKIIKLKNLNEELVEDSPLNNKSKKSVIIYNNKDEIKKKESFNSLKFKSNDLDTKNDVLKTDRAEVNECVKKKEKYKILRCFLCCLNSK